MYFAEQKCQNVGTHLYFQDQRIYGTHGYFNMASASLIQQMFIVLMTIMTCTMIVIQLHNLEERPSVLPFDILA